MNREILFRGKRIDNGEWVEGYFSVSHEKKGDRYFIINTKAEVSWMHKPRIGWKFSNIIEIVPETLGQFTGLTDKNGVKMFEDDCVKITFTKDERYNRLTFYNNELPDYLISVMKYNERRCHFQLEFEENNPYKIVSCEIGWYKDNFEVVGNIHDKI